MNNTDNELEEIFKRTHIDHPKELMADIEAYISKREANLKADIAYAIGHGKGCGHPITYLEKRYPQLHKEKLNLGDK